jgi:hypothetical protein
MMKTWPPMPSVFDQALHPLLIDEESLSAAPWGDDRPRAHDSLSSSLRSGEEANPPLATAQSSKGHCPVHATSIPPLRALLDRVLSSEHDLALLHSH